MSRLAQPTWSFPGPPSGEGAARKTTASAAAASFMGSLQERMLVLTRRRLRNFVALTMDLRGLPEGPVEEFVRRLPRLRREVVAGVRVVGYQAVLPAQELVDRRGGGDAVLHPGHVEVRVVQRRVHEERPRGQRGDDF